MHAPYGVTEYYIKKALEAGKEFRTVIAYIFRWGRHYKMTELESQCLRSTGEDVSVLNLEDYKYEKQRELAKQFCKDHKIYCGDPLPDISVSEGRMIEVGDPLPDILVYQKEE